MFKWALKDGRIVDNPCLGVERERISTKGFKPWTESEVDRYEAHWPIGSMARLALAVMLYTGARRGEKASVSSGEESLTTGKFRARLPAQSLPLVHPQRMQKHRAQIECSINHCINSMENLPKGM